MRDDDVRERFIMQGKVPILVIALTVQEVFFHCTKCVLRSGLWLSEHKLDGLASFGKAIVKHAKLDMSIEEADAMVAEEKNHLY